ncbi:MAG: hypothetical protein NE327_22575 [Lentisphaeraceae bacterium]|nr:hypothetical protein [Lentisphaeraceae bacterium]
MNEVSSLLEAFHTSIGYLDTKRLLTEQEITTSRRWDKIDSALKELKSARIISLKKAVRDAVEEGYLFKNKNIFSYNLDEGDKAKIQKSILELEIEKSKLRDCYPFPNVDCNVKKPIITEIIDNEKGRLVVFCSIRTHVERFDVDNKHIRVVSEHEEAYRNVSFIGVRSKKRQAYDAIFLPKNGKYFEIWVDAFSSTEKNTAIKNNILSSIGLDIKPKGIDFFPAIDNIYKNELNCSICELAFECGTGATHRLYYRRSDFSDLRNEDYHSMGVEGLETGIDIYKLGVRCVFDKVYIEIYFPGTKANLNGKEPLKYYHIDGTAGKEDFFKTKELILTYL